MIPDDYDSLSVKTLKSFLDGCSDDDLVVFKSRNNYLFSGYGIQCDGDGLVLSFDSTPVYHMEGGLFKDFKHYNHNCISFDLLDYPFLDWMVFEAYNKLVSEGDFIEFYDVDDRLLGRLNYFDGCYVDDNHLVILKDSDVNSMIKVQGVSYFVDLESVYYMRFCLF